MDGVQASDRLAGERVTSSVDDLPRDGHEAPVEYHTRQDHPEPGRALLPNQGERGGSNQASIALEEGEVRGRDGLGVIDGLDRAPAARLPEQPGENRARLGVENQLSLRSSARRR